MNAYIKNAYYDCILIVTQGNMWYFYKNLKRKPKEIMMIDNICEEISTAQIEYCKKNKINYIVDEKDKVILQEWIKRDNIAFVISGDVNDLKEEDLEKIQSGYKGKQHWNELEKKQTPKVYVKYHNNLNEIVFENFNEKDFDIFMTIVAFLKDKGTDMIYIDFSKIEELLGVEITSVQKLVALIDNMYNKLSAVKCVRVGEDEIKFFTVFPTFTIDKKNKRLAIQVHEDFKYFFNDFDGGCFSFYDSDDYKKLSGKYVKFMFVHLRQYIHGEGWWHVSSEKFRSLMLIPDTYTNRNVVAKVIKPCIEALSPYFEDLRCDIVYEDKPGNPIKGYRFSFKPEKKNISNKANNDHAQIGISMKEEKSLLKETKSIKSKNVFNNYQQNIYDYDLLEKTILSN